MNRCPRSRKVALRTLLAAVVLATGTAALPAVAGGIDAYDWLPRERLSTGAWWLLEPPPAPASRAATTADEVRSASRRALATLDVVGENIRLGDDPPELPAARHAQAEPHAARSFRDPGLVLATFQEGRFEDGGAVGCGYAVTRDGGATWERRWIPGLVQAVDGGVFDRASDPVAAVGADGTLWLNTLGLRNTPDGFLTSIALSRSTDGGRTFSPPMIVRESADTLNFLDKNWMAVNSFPGTPTAGRLVITLTHFQTIPNRSLTYPVVLTYSDDQGGTWSDLHPITPNYCQGSQPVFLPDGALAVGYWNFNIPNPDRIEVVVSEDGGATFGPAHVVAEVTIHHDPVARSGEFLPSLAADRTLGNLHFAWQAVEAGAPRILFARSTDRGQSWSAPVPVNDTPAGRSVFNPAIAVSPEGQHVTIIFYDKRHDVGAGNWADLYLAESFDSGLTWEPNRRISASSTDLTRAPLTPAGRMVGDYLGLVPALTLQEPGIAVWVDTREGSPDPFAATIHRRLPASFDHWQRLLFPAGALLAGPDEDPDADRLPNLLEYLLGLHPLVANPSPMIPLVGPPSNPAAGWLIDILADVTDVELAPIESVDLREWTPFEAQPAATLPPEAFRRRLRLSPPALAAGAAFVRPGARASSVDGP